MWLFLEALSVPGSAGLVKFLLRKWISRTFRMFLLDRQQASVAYPFTRATGGIVTGASGETTHGYLSG